MISKGGMYKYGVAALIAIVALIISYTCTNMNYALSGEKATLKYWRIFTELISKSQEKLPDDVVFINVDHDKQLVNITDEFGIPVGNAAITDRQKIARLLDIIEESGSYKYVMMDVFFESGYETESDSTLFSRIASMERIVIPKHVTGSLGNPALDAKSAYADYVTTIKETSFTKYLLFRKDGPSMPLKSYSDITGHTVKRVGLWYADNGSLARKVIFPKMYVKILSPYRMDGQKAYLNIGEDILDVAEVVDWVDFFKGKYVLIGSYTGEDSHLSYAGNIPGCLINFNVFLSLMKGQHKIPFVLILVYFFIFFVMAYLILNSNAVLSQSWGWILAKIFTIYSLILTIVCIFVFAIWGQAHDIFITSTFFSIIDMVNRKLKKNKKQQHA
ncbi:MAG: CHASE2 domain-containing protein [Bacteroidales bacterium]|nr:CHASE2 domain-containing protein [Bacteroidales bacterium]